MSNSVLTKTEGSLYRQVGRPPFTFIVSPLELPPASPLDSNPTSVSTSRRKLWSDLGRHLVGHWQSLSAPVGLNHKCPGLPTTHWGSLMFICGRHFFLWDSLIMLYQLACLSHWRKAAYDFINLAPESDCQLIYLPAHGKYGELKILPHVINCDQLCSIFQSTTQIFNSVACALVR